MNARIRWWHRITEEHFNREGRQIVRSGVRDFPAAVAFGETILVMDQDDPEKRIAELERQLAGARAAGDPGANQGYKTTRGWLTPEQVRNVAFSKPPIGARGYNEDEVDAFLDRVRSKRNRGGARFRRHRKQGCRRQRPARLRRHPLAGCPLGTPLAPRPGSVGVLTL